jgi:hypothetical protein
MSNQLDGFGKEIDAKLSKMSDYWINDQFYECLVDACDFFLSVKNDRGSRLNKVALEFIHQSSTCLNKKKDDDGPKKPTVACSFCGKAAPEVRLGAGPVAFICNECVATFHAIL